MTSRNLFLIRQLHTRFVLYVCLRELRISNDYYIFVALASFSMKTIIMMISHVYANNITKVQSVTMAYDTKKHGVPKDHHNLISHPPFVQLTKEKTIILPKLKGSSLFGQLVANNVNTCCPRVGHWLQIMFARQGNTQNRFYVDLYEI